MIVPHLKKTHITNLKTRRDIKQSFSELVVNVFNISSLKTDTWIAHSKGLQHQQNSDVHMYS